ncbi:hypothetical protein [Corynebacterium kutscheri]|nr:hypothetical protein [Corynebacterium kutscheri]
MTYPVLRSVDKEFTLRLHKTLPPRYRDESGSGYCTIGLSEQLDAAIVCDSTPLSNSDVARLGYLPRTLWDQAAQTMLRRAYIPGGIAVDIRDSFYLTRLATPGLQVAVPGAPISAWLAHPQTFHLLYQHLHSLLGSAPKFFLPRENILIALRVEDNATSLIHWGHNEYRNLLCPELVYYSCGFPVHNAPFGYGEELNPIALNNRKIA